MFHTAGPARFPTDSRVHGTSRSSHAEDRREARDTKHLYVSSGNHMAMRYIIRILRAIDEFALSVDRAALMDECSFAGMASVFALTSTDR